MADNSHHEPQQEEVKMVYLFAIMVMVHGFITGRLDYVTNAVLYCTYIMATSAEYVKK